MKQRLPLLFYCARTATSGRLTIAPVLRHFFYIVPTALYPLGHVLNSDELVTGA